MRGARMLAVLTALLVSSGDARAGDIVRTYPPLVPGYDPDVRDFATWCAGHGSVRFTAEPAGGAAVAVGAGPLLARPFARRIRLEPGEAYRFTVHSAGGTVRRHHVRCLPADFPPWRADVTEATEAEFYAVGAGSHAIVFDANGVPVWWMRHRTFPLDVKLLRGRRIAWAGFGGYPFGIDALAAYTIRRLEGRAVGTVSTVGSPPDAHELEESRDGSFYMWTYRPRDGVDLSSWDGPVDASVVEGEVQHIGRDGRLLWRWNAAEHIPNDEIRSWIDLPLIEIPLPGGRGVYDIHHANSIDEMPNGDLLLSLRRPNAVYRIRRRTGEVVWKLGGTRRPESLRVIGDPFAHGQLHGWRPPRTQLVRSDPEARLLFGGQHDARVAPDGTITVFDNGLTAARPPRIVRYRIDERARTATMLEQHREPGLEISINSGSARRLPGGSWVVSWGGNPLVTELAPDGRRVLALRFREARTYRVDPILRGRLSRRELRAAMEAMPSSHRR